MHGYKVRAVREYYKRIHPLSYYTDTKFIQRYRLSKGVTRLLIKEFEKDQKPVDLRGKHAIPYSLRFCVALRYFATGANYLAIGDCHGVSKSIVCQSVQQVSDFFRNHLQDYVKWPDSETAKLCKAMRFYQKPYKRRHVPRCFGLVDGTHVAIACPRGVTNDENQYYCYKGYYSINAMVICDYDGVFTHVNAASPGSCNDIYVMNGSQVKYLGERDDFKGYYLLGDSGYMLTDYLLTPVRYEQNQAQVEFNKWHKKTRSQVERSIGILKQRWRCLDTSGGYLFHSPERAACIIESCVSLHNCAKAGRVKLMKDFPAKDGFRRVQQRIEQPENQGRQERVPFANKRDFFIQDHFSGIPLTVPHA